MYKRQTTCDRAVGEEKQFGHVDAIINIIGVQQDLPQRIVKFVIRRLGYKKQSDNYHHLGYELVRLSEASFSGRKGVWIGYTADELYDEGYKKIQKLIEGKDFSELDKQIIADALTVNAIKYSFLRVSPEKVMTFDWKTALNMEGDSGPYLTYALVRGISIVNKFDFNEINGLKTVEKYEFNEFEKRVLRNLVMFNDVVEKSAKEFRPNVLVEYLTRLVSEYNRFYENCPVLSSKGDTKYIRVAIVLLFIKTILTGMRLLGMKPINKM